MIKKKHTNKSEILNKTLLAVWPLSPIVLLPTLGLLVTLPTISTLNADTYTTRLDENFWITAVIIIVGHIIAFSAIPLVLYKRGFFKSAERIQLSVLVGLFTVLLQGVLRVMSDNVSRLDCSDSCVESVMPAALGSILNILTFVSLFVVLAVFSGFMVKKLAELRL